MHRIAYINNRFVKFNKAKIHIEDRGLQFSDSVYEVLLVINSNLIDFDYHIRRLKYSLKELSINYKVNKDKIKYIFNKLIKCNFINNGIIYLQITRGIQSREHAYKKNLKPTIISYTQKKNLTYQTNIFKLIKQLLILT